MMLSTHIVWSPTVFPLEFTVPSTDRVKHMRKDAEKKAIHTYYGIQSTCCQLINDVLIYKNSLPLY